MQPDIIANKQNSNKDNLFFILSCIFPFSSKFHRHGNKINFRQQKKWSEKSPLIFEEILHSIQNDKINDLHIILDFLFFPVLDLCRDGDDLPDVVSVRDLDVRLYLGVHCDFDDHFAPYLPV